MFTKNTIFMKQLTIREQVMISEDINNWLTILENRYHLKRSEFIRTAIVEKMRRDIKTLRLKKQSEDNFCPF